MEQEGRINGGVSRSKNITNKEMRKLGERRERERRCTRNEFNRSENIPMDEQQSALCLDRGSLEVLLQGASLAGRRSEEEMPGAGISEPGTATSKSTIRCADRFQYVNVLPL